MTADTDTVNVATTTVQAIIDNADRLGLTWDIKPATVSRAIPPAVTVDGDTVSIGATSIIGRLALGQRVYVIIVPPSAVFVIGLAGEPFRLLARGQRSAPKTGIAGTELGVVRVNTILPAGFTYRVSTNVLFVQSTLNELARIDLRIRYTSDHTDATTGGIVGVLDRFITDAGSGNTYGNLFFYYFAVADTQFSTLLTVVRTTGAGTVTLSDSVNAGPSLFIEQVGILVDNTGVDV